MKTTIRTLALGLALGGLLGACGDDDEASTSGSAIEATPVESGAVEPTGSDDPVDLEERLLTTEEIGGGWISQGPVTIPPGSEQRTGFLCPEGQALADPLGSSFDPQVSVLFVQESVPTANVSEALLSGPTEQIIADFEVWSSAIDVCVGSEWETPEFGPATIEAVTVPDVGAEGIGFHLTSPNPPTDSPWLEVTNYEYLLTEPNADMAMVLQISMPVIHEPGVEASPVEEEELARIAEAAIDVALGAGG